jgi:hypothetical protein
MKLEALPMRAWRLTTRQMKNFDNKPSPSSFSPHFRSSSLRLLLDLKRA